MAGYYFDLDQKKQTPNIVQSNMDPWKWRENDVVLGNFQIIGDLTPYNRHKKQQKFDKIIAPSQHSLDSSNKLDIH